MIPIFNSQPASPVVSHMSDGSFLAVHSVFGTIQGEGPFAGVPATFIRLAGCNLQCPQCDTQYTSDDLQHVMSLVAKAEEHKNKLVVITGGEPLRQNIEFLVNALISNGHYVQIETNGTLPLPGQLFRLTGFNPDLRRGLYVVCSPKTPKIHPKLSRYICALKYVVDDNPLCADGLPVHVLGLEFHAGLRVARPPSDFSGTIYVQPADHQDPEINKNNLDAAIESCREHGHTLCIQMHKIINVE